MLWNDPNFDYNDQLASKYMKYQGQYYDVGTKVMIKGPRGPVKATFLGWKYKSRGCFEPESGSYFDLYDTYTFSACNVYILEILEPVAPHLQVVAGKSDNRDKPPSWTVEVAWIWYIVIMIGLAFFKARWLGWIAATVIFFGWKSGSLVIRKNKYI